jgi:DNA (cytosine-5)-methyltransferase 1
MTPTAQSGGSHPEEGHLLLDRQAKWATPTVADIKGPSGPNCQAFKVGNINRLADQLQKLEERPDSSWPTPAARDWKGEWERGGTNAHPGPQLPDVASSWPTPQSSDCHNARSPEKLEERAGQFRRLTDEVQRQEWPTPSVADVTGGHTSRSGDRIGEKLLPQMAKALSSPGTVRDGQHWPTPRAFDGHGPQRSSTDDPNLPAAMLEWPTPNAAGGTGYMSGSNCDTWRPTLEGAARGLRPELHRGRPDPSTPPAGVSTSPAGRVLNPLFVEALMGLPIGWTDLGR